MKGVGSCYTEAVDGGRVRRWWTAMLVLSGLAAASPALAQGSWSETTEVDITPSQRAARIGFQRDRLAVRNTDPGWYVIVDGYGRVLSAQQFARALGDARTYDLTLRAGRRQNTVGAVVTSAGPITMLVGLSRVTEGSWREVEVMEAAGYARWNCAAGGSAPAAAADLLRRGSGPPAGPGLQPPAARGLRPVGRRSVAGPPGPPPRAR